jgi:hypothetical protein
LGEPGMTDPSNPPIRPPPIAQHLREFAERRDAWVILARNLIPVAGLYVFGWSTDLAVFNYWFDGFAALSAIVAALIPRAMRETQVAPDGVAARVNYVLVGLILWAFLTALVGLPYWIVLIPLHDVLLGEAVRDEVLHSHWLWLTFGVLAAGHYWRAFQVGYDTLPENELKQRARWDLYLLLLRAVSMFLIAGGGFAFLIVPLMALLMSYFEIWPERVIGAVFGDPKRLYEYDPDQAKKKKRKKR